MISPISQKTNHPATVTPPRRLAAALLTLLFAFCVLVASAPHRHVGDASGQLSTRSAQVGTARSSRAAALAAVVQTADAACPLCDWLYAPTLPATAPVLPPLAFAARHFAPLPPALASRLLDAAPSRSSSRAPPTPV